MNVTVSNVLPTVYIDTPAPGAVVSGTVTVAGWALDSSTLVGSAINTVQVKVDGVVVGTATYGTARPDVCGVFPARAGCPNVGFTFPLNTSNLSAGFHLLAVVATDKDVNADSNTWSISIVVPTLPSVVIDTPVGGSTIAGLINVSGWAIDSTSAVGTAIGKVAILIDGSQVGLATYGISRPDVCAAFPGRPGCPNVGFNFALDSTTLSPGQHTIRAQATDTDSPAQTTNGDVVVTVSGATPPKVQIDTPVSGAHVSGVVTVAGWAIDNTGGIGTAISRVLLLVDGNQVGTAAYGAARPDVCAAFAGRPGCPNVGFTFSLNTGTLAAGAHTIRVIATNSNASPISGYQDVGMIK